MNLIKIIDKFINVNVLVLGDIVLDRYICGTSNRIASEAPIPVVSVDNCFCAAGGAANVAINSAQLGCFVDLCGIIGNDKYGEKIKSLLLENSVNIDNLIVSETSSTIIKTRILSSGQYIARYDKEEKYPGNYICNRIKQIKKKYNVIIISDYDKGTIVSGVMRLLKSHFSSIPIVVDPKPINYRRYKNVYCITPNLHEAKQMVSKNISSLLEMAQSIKNKLNLFSIIITLSRNGVFVLDERNKFAHYEPHTPSFSCERYQRIDTVGAGDTFISTFSACVSTGCDILTSVILSNIAAGIVCNKFGTACCNFNELKNELRSKEDKKKK